MRLYLCRHGHAGESKKGDFYRELNHDGQREVAALAARPVIMERRADLMVSSPALRALQTAEIMAGQLRYPWKKIITDRCIYDQEVDEIVGFIGALCVEESDVWLFGHNPSLAWLASRLSGLPEAKNPPGAVVAIEFEAADWTAALAGVGRVLFREIP